MYIRAHVTSILYKCVQIVDIVQFKCNFHKKQAHLFIFFLLFHRSSNGTKVIHPDNESWFFFSFSFSLSRCLGFKMKVVQFFKDLVVDVSRVVLVLHCSIDGVPAFLQTFNCKVRNLSTVTKFWRIIYETLKRAFLQLFLGPEHLNNISPVCCRHIVEREIVLAGKSEALGRHLWWKSCKSLKKCHWRRTSMFSSILLAASNVGMAGRYWRSSVYQVVRFLYVT